MRQIISGCSVSSKLGTYKLVIDEESLSAMQSNTKQRRVLKKPKRFRSAFTTGQTNYLEEQYKKYQYINKEQRLKVASVLKIGERPIKIWFQNRRMKEKKENHKELNDEICGDAQKNDKDQLNNVSVLPSANDRRLYSLPILSFTADTLIHANSNDMKANIVDSKEKPTTKLSSPNNMIPSIEQKIPPPRANFYNEVNYQEHSPPYFHEQPIVDTTVLLTSDAINKNPPSQEYKSITSAEFSINLCKKYKQHSASTTDAVVTGNLVNEDQKMKTEPKLAPKIDMNQFNLPKNLPPTKKCKVSNPPPPKLSAQMNLNNSMYYPVMPSMYSPSLTSLPPPYVAPDGILWKPVNYMPVLATSPSHMNSIGHRAPPAHEQNRSCICNCHESSPNLPVTFSPNIQNPYAQYVITVPFPNTSSSF